MNDPKLDKMIKGGLEKGGDSIFQIVIQYNTETNGCRLQYPIGPNNMMFWGAIWSAMRETELVFSKMRLAEMAKFDAKVEKKVDLIIPKPGLM